MKKTLKLNSKIILLLTVISILPSGFLFSAFGNFNVSTKLKEEQNTDEIPNPKISEPDFGEVNKTIFHGSQDDPPFVPDHIRYSDDVVDSTTFTPGYKSSDLRDVADYGVVDYTLEGFGKFGSTDKGDWWFTTAYKDNDAKYLYLETYNYYGWMNMKWGAYSNIPTGAHAYVRQININYEVWADSYLGWLDQSTWLTLRVYDDQGNWAQHTIAQNPVDDHHYISTMYITSGTVFDRIKTGGYIKYMEVLMFDGEEILTYTWINVDFVDIYYLYDMSDADFYYTLDFGGYGLSTVTQFELKVELEETYSETDVHLYDFVSSTWVEVLSIDTVGVHTKDIVANADNYFSQTKKLRVRFEKYNQWDGRAYTQYQIKVDMVQINIPPPDPPDPIEITQGILHLLLTWGVPNSYGAPIIQYNIYRGTVEGANNKTLIDTSPTNEYNDTTGVVGTTYYYTISASSSAGEGGNSTEVSGQTYDQPFVDWLTPAVNASVIFPYNQSDQNDEWKIFHFTYDYEEVDEVKLIINGFDYGNVWNQSSCRIYPFYKGTVTATLEGYNSSILVASDTREFEFINIEFERMDMLETNLTFIGQQLYLILHDPNGDQSYTYYTETSTYSVGGGYEITDDARFVLGIDGIASLFGNDVGAREDLTRHETTEVGIQFRFELTDTTGLTSNQDSSDPDYIGPGYGDLYWGEAWFFRHELNATYRIYSNGSIGHEKPKLYYGIHRDAEVLLNDIYAPQEWRNQNPVNNNYENVTWNPNDFGGWGGYPYTKSVAVTNTIERKFAFSIELGSYTFIDGGAIEGTIDLSQTLKTYAETGEGHTLETGYFISDNEPTDFIAMERGIDQKFGSYIFRTLSYECQTSNPLEHNTFDYVPPVIDFPVIDYDSNSDGQSPCPDDTPKVTVDIFEEGGISDAIIMYSINNGSSWDIEFLSELSGDPGTWEGTLPAQPVNTTVLWYIQAWDIEGNNDTRYNPYLNPFEYTVIPVVQDSDIIDIPGIPLVSIIPITIVSIIAITVIYYRKRKT